MYGLHHCVMMWQKVQILWQTVMMTWQKVQILWQTAMMTWQKVQILGQTVTGDWAKEGTGENQDKGVLPFWKPGWGAASV